MKKYFEITHRQFNELTRADLPYLEIFLINPYILNILTKEEDRGKQKVKEEILEFEIVIRMKYREDETLIHKESWEREKNWKERIVKSNATQINMGLWSEEIRKVLRRYVNSYRQTEAEYGPRFILNESYKRHRLLLSFERMSYKVQYTNPLTLSLTSQAYAELYPHGIYTIKDIVFYFPTINFRR
jgi:hypothetical protein